MQRKMRLARLTFFATLLVAAAVNAAHATYCRAPPRPAHGGHSGQSYSSFRVGTVVKYWCERGYRLLGSEYRRCAVRGNSVYWDRSTPVCICKYLRLYEGATNCCTSLHHSCASCVSCVCVGVAGGGGVGAVNSLQEV